MYTGFANLIFSESMHIVAKKVFFGKQPQMLGFEGMHPKIARQQPTVPDVPSVDQYLPVPPAKVMLINLLQDGALLFRIIRPTF